MTSSLVLLLMASAFAGKSKVGTTAYPFLKIGIGARALSMGGAFAGLANDESAVYYNPAGLVAMQQRSLAGSYMNYIADIQAGSFTFVSPRGVTAAADLPLDDNGNPVPTDAQAAFAVNINYLNYGDFDATDNTGEVIDQFGGSDLAFTISYARKVGPQLALGANAKFIYQKIDEFDSQGLAADLGLLYRLQDGRTNFGVSASNLGVQLNGLSEDHKDPLPIILRAGLSHRLREIPLSVSGELALPTDNDVFGAVGLEFHPNAPVALRAGYSSFGSNYKTNGDKDNTAGFAFGVGFIFNQIRVDYAFLPYADLGSLHRANLSYRW